MKRAMRSLGPLLLCLPLAAFAGGGVSAPSPSPPPPAQAPERREPGTLPSERTPPAAQVPAGTRLTPGWFLAGSTPQLYEVSKAVTPDAECGGSLLRSKAGEGHGFGTVMQVFKADAFRGKRVRFSARLRAAQVTRWAGLWMRVDGADKKALAYDNMQTRPLVGSLPCATYSVVLDVPRDAEQVALGLLLAGKGTLFMRMGAIEPVGPEIPVTDLLVTGGLPVQDGPVK